MDNVRVLQSANPVNGFSQKVASCMAAAREDLFVALKTQGSLPPHERTLQSAWVTLCP